MILGQWDRAQGGGALASPSALARKVAGEAGAHSYMTFNTCYKDSGLFGLYLVAPPEGVDDAVRETMTYLSQLAKRPDEALKDDDVHRAKAQLKANIISQLDALAHVCEEIGRQFLTYDRRVPLAELLARVDAVSPADLKATAAHFLKDQPHAQAVYGSIANLRPFDACHISNY